MDDLPYAIATPDTQGGLCFLHSVEGDRYYTLDGALRYPTILAAREGIVIAEGLQNRPRSYLVVNINELKRQLA